MAKKAQKAKKGAAAKKATIVRKPKTAKKAKAAKRVTKSTATATATPPVRAPRGLEVAVAVAGGCLDLISAGEIVQDAIPGGPHDIDHTLEDAGLITDGQRTIFRSHVVQAVEDRGCAIEIGDVPNDADTTLRDARTAVSEHARPGHA